MRKITSSVMALLLVAMLVLPFVPMPSASEIYDYYTLEQTTLNFPSYGVYSILGGEIEMFDPLETIKGLPEYTTNWGSLFIITKSANSNTYRVDFCSAIVPVLDTSDVELLRLDLTAHCLAYYDIYAGTWTYTEEDYTTSHFFTPPESTGIYEFCGNFTISYNGVTYESPYLGAVTTEIPSVDFSTELKFNVTYGCIPAVTAVDGYPYVFVSVAEADSYGYLVSFYFTTTPFVLDWNKTYAYIHRSFYVDRSRGAVYDDSTSTATGNIPVSLDSIVFSNYNIFDQSFQVAYSATADKWVPAGLYSNSNNIENKTGCFFIRCFSPGRNEYQTKPIPFFNLESYPGQMLIQDFTYAYIGEFDLNFRFTGTKYRLEGMRPLETYSSQTLSFDESSYWASNFVMRRGYEFLGYPFENYVSNMYPYSTFDGFVGSVSVTAPQGYCYRGETLQFSSVSYDNAGNTDINQNVYWDNNSSKSGISNSGLLSVYQYEDAEQITVYASSILDTNVRGSYTIDVYGYKNVDIRIIDSQNYPGGSIQFGVTYTAIGNPVNSFEWTITEVTSSDTYIDDSGFLHIGADETVDSIGVRATSTYGNVSDYTVVYLQYPTIDGISVTFPQDHVRPGQTVQATASVTSSGTIDTSVTWAVSGNLSSFTTISNTGLLSIGSNETSGSVRVTATSTVDPTKYGSNSIDVGMVTGISVAQVGSDPFQGENCLISAEISGVGTYDDSCIFSISGNASSDTYIDPNGTLHISYTETSTSIVVTATAAGDSSYSASVTVTVIPIPLEDIAVSPKNSTVMVGVPFEKQFSIAYSDGTPWDGPAPTWILRYFPAGSMTPQDPPSGLASITDDGLLTCTGNAADGAILSVVASFPTGQLETAFVEFTNDTDVYLQNIINGSDEQQKEVDKGKAEITDKIDELEEIDRVAGGATIPEFDESILDIDNASEGITIMGMLLGYFMNNSVISANLTFAFLFALVAYAIFGKR